MRWNIGCEVTKVSRYFWIGNRAVLDFINTEVAVEGEPLELLGDAEALRQWLREAGLVSGKGAEVRLPTAWMEEARRYRAELHRGIARLAAGKPVPAALLKQTNAYLERDTGHRRLARAGDGYRLLVERRFVAAADFLAPIAASFAEMVAKDDLRRLRRCRNPECVLFFYDTSKGGQRAWCSLEQCGNKLRMAALRSRRGAAGSD